MKQHTMPSKYLLPPILTEKELEEWNDKVRESMLRLEDMNEQELDEEIARLFKLEKQRKRGLL